MISVFRKIYHVFMWMHPNWYTRQEYRESILGLYECGNRRRAAYDLSCWDLYRDDLIAPLCTWFLFALYVGYLRLVFHPRLVSLHERFEEICENADQKCGYEALRQDWQDGHHGREQQRAGWTQAERRFADWASWDARNRRSGAHTGSTFRAYGSPYETALALLELREPFTRAEFKKAWKRAVFAHHPDRGGDVIKAQAINGAKELISQRKGW